MLEITRALLTASLLCAPLALAQPIAYVASVKPNDAVEARGFSEYSPGGRFTASAVALQEQLGLKLVADKAPVAVVVVDRLEEPSAN